MRIFRVHNSTGTGPLIFADDAADAIRLAVVAGRVRNPAKAKAIDMTTTFRHPWEKTERALASGRKGIAYYRVNGADSPTIQRFAGALGLPQPSPTPVSGWLVDGEFVS